MERPVSSFQSRKEFVTPSLAKRGLSSGPKPEYFKGGVAYIYICICVAICGFTTSATRTKLTLAVSTTNSTTNTQPALRKSPGTPAAQRSPGKSFCTFWQASDRDQRIDGSRSRARRGMVLACGLASWCFLLSLLLGFFLGCFLVCKLIGFFIGWFLSCLVWLVPWPSFFGFLRLLICYRINILLALRMGPTKFIQTGVPNKA